MFLLLTTLVTIAYGCTDLNSMCGALIANLGCDGSIPANGMAVSQACCASCTSQTDSGAGAADACTNTLAATQCGQAMAMVGCDGSTVLGPVSNLCCAACAAAAAAADDASDDDSTPNCAPTQGDHRHQSPTFANNLLGYGSACAGLPGAIMDAGAAASTTVPDLSGTYSADSSHCPMGSQIRIEQSGTEIVFVTAGVVHHFVAEAAGCPAVCQDWKHAYLAGMSPTGPMFVPCVGTDFDSLSAACNTGVVNANPNLSANCWTLVFSGGSGTVEWCKTASGLSRTASVGPVTQVTTYSVTE